MTLLKTPGIPSAGRHSGVLLAGQVILSFLSIIIGSIFILCTVETSSFSTIILFAFVTITGLILCKKAQTQLNDPALSILGYLWLLKLVLTFIILYAGWIPQLDPSSSSIWGYDPQRYYFQAQELVDNNWLADFVSLNYTGVLYYYGVIFYFFGHNPVVPALANAFLTLVATLYLVRVGYEIKQHRAPRDWTLALALLLPEILWFDVMTSRETLLAALLIFALLTVGRYLLRTTDISSGKILTIITLSVLAIAAIRTTMTFPVVIATVLMVLLIGTSRRLHVFRKYSLIFCIVATAIVSPYVPTLIGGYEVDSAKIFYSAISANDNIALAGDMSWNENSIGMLLMPDGVIQSICFLPPRMVLYLLTPLPKVSFTFSDLMLGRWLAWQGLLTMLSSLINIILIPYVLASLIYSVKNRKKDSGPLIFHISYVLVFMAVAGGNLIIQERYRVMATPLLWGCAWLGMQAAPKYYVRVAAFSWYALLAVGATFYFYYKAGMFA